VINPKSQENHSDWDNLNLHLPLFPKKRLQYQLVLGQVLTMIGCSQNAVVATFLSRIKAIKGISRKKVGLDAQSLR